MRNRKRLSILNAAILPFASFMPVMHWTIDGDGMIGGGASPNDGPGLDTSGEPETTIAGSEGQDTIAPNGDDTLTGGDGDDTTQGGAGGDTVKGDEAADAVPGATADETPVKPRIRPQITVESDALDKEFDEAIKAIDGDEMLSVGQKAKEKLELKTKWEERTERRQAKAQENQDSIWQNESARTGVAAEQCENTWQTITDELNARGVAYTRDYATGLYHERIKALKPGKTKPIPTQDPPVNVAPTGKGRILPKGASAGGRVAAPSVDGRTVMEKVRDGDKSTMKEIAEINQAFQAGEL